MLIKKAYKVELNPNKIQIRSFYHYCGCCRYVYNWGLAQRKKVYEETKKTITYFTQTGELTKLKQAECTWLYEVSSSALNGSLKDLDGAFKHFFRRIKLAKKGQLPAGETLGFPKIRARGVKNSFRVSDASVHIEATRIKLPKIGWVRLKESEYIPTDSNIKNVTVSEHAGHWFVSVQVEEIIDDNNNISNSEILAIHIGIRQRITCSNGLIIDKLLPYQKAEKKLKRLQKKLSRRKKGSKNRNKARQAVNKLHYNIANIRKDANHKATTEIISQSPGVIIIEDWSNKKMMMEGKYAKGIADTAFYELRRQLEYKSEWAGIKVILVERGFPSSKTCSECGFLHKEFKLSELIFKCPSCGTKIDRELNAVKNVRQQGLEQLQLEKVDMSTGAQPESNACGE